MCSVCEVPVVDVAIGQVTLVGVFATLSPFRAISFSLEGCRLRKSIPNALEIRVLDMERKSYIIF